MAKESNKKAISKLQTQMSHLRWKKMSTESRMQGMLHHTKTLKERDRVLLLGRNRTEETLRWKQAIIRDEMKRPLEASSDFMTTFMQQNENEEKRARDALKQHSKNIRANKKQAKERDDQRCRNKTFLEKKKLLFRPKTTTNLVDKNNSSDDQLLSSMVETSLRIE